MTRISDAIVRLYTYAWLFMSTRTNHFVGKMNFHARACAFWSNAACHVSMTLARPPIELLLVHPWASTHIQGVLHAACTRELHHEYETRLGGHVHTRASVRLMHGMATYGMSCFGLCLYIFRPHQHHFVSVWHLRHLAFAASTTAKVPSSAACLPKFVL